MSKTRYRWWGYVKNIIRAYPALDREEAAIKEQPITANVSGMPRGGSAERKTESVALRQLPRSQQAELDAVRAAILTIKKTPYGVEIMRLIDMVFWRQSHTLSGAAYELNISYDTAKRYHKMFIMAVARNRGLLED